MKQMMDTNIGFIGTGQMALALASGFVKSESINPSHLFGYDISSEAGVRFAKETGGTIVSSIEQLVKSSQIVFLAVKPQQMGVVLHAVSAVQVTGVHPLWITIAAGIPLATYLKELGTTARMIRVMPNTPCLVGEGVSGYCVSSGVTQADVVAAQHLLSTVGTAILFPERQLDAVSGLSGSGPAYVYMMIEAMADGGVKMGLSREVSLKLATQTVFGAAKVVIQTGEHPAVLKDRVCSPRGTTISAVHSLEANGFRAAVISAVEAATHRSKELASE
ncbi:MAG: pyrroline-5-carboxylate reductase [Thermoguttaceae bacterium]